jgi:hypothetical protein
VTDGWKADATNKYAAQNQKDFNLLAAADRHLGRITPSETSVGRGVVDPLKILSGTQGALNRQQQSSQFAQQLANQKEVARIKAPGKAAGGVSENTFEKGFNREAGKLAAQNKLKGGVAKAINEMDNINVALAELTRYSKESIGGTGPFATVFGLTGKTTESGQRIRAAFNRVSLSSMQKLFEGMARAIDSDAERAFFQSTQPSLNLDDSVNAKILVGAKVAGAKQAAEERARQAYIAQNGQLDASYTSPLVSTTAVLNEAGQVMIITPDQLEGARRSGLYTPDEWVEAHFGSKRPPLGRTLDGDGGTGLTPEEKAELEQLHQLGAP